MTASISSMPAPPGPPERYTSVDAATSESSSRASFSGTVPGIDPLRSSGTVSVEHCGAALDPAPRHLCQFSAQDEPGSASEAASATTSPSVKRVRTPGIRERAYAGCSAAQPRWTTLRAEPDLDERLVCGAIATEVGAEEGERPAV